MRVLSLFSGIGGLDLGLERAGMTVVRQIEKDAFCRRVLRKHWPDVRIDDDVTTAEFVDGEADVVCGGFPCQDVSNAGKRAGISAERSGLYRELVRAIRVVRPLYAIVENVAALLGRGMGTVLGDLAEIGYDTEWDCIPACSVGAPHCRDRVFITASDTQRGEWRAQPYFWATRRMGRIVKSVSWDGGWKAALAKFRGVDDGVPRSVERTDAIRNAVVPAVAEVVGRAVMEAHAKSGGVG